MSKPERIWAEEVKASGTVLHLRRAGKIVELRDVRNVLSLGYETILDESGYLYIPYIL